MASASASAYPYYVYAHDGRAVQVHNDRQLEVLGEGWYLSRDEASRHPEPKAGPVPAAFARNHPVSPSSPRA